MYKTFYSWFSLHFFVRFMEKKRLIKCFGIFVHFYEVVKFPMIKLFLDVYDVIHANEFTKYTNPDLPVTFGFFC